MQHCVFVKLYNIFFFLCFASRYSGNQLLKNFITRHYCTKIKPTPFSFTVLSHMVKMLGPYNYISITRSCRDNLRRVLLGSYCIIKTLFPTPTIFEKSSHFQVCVMKQIIFCLYIINLVKAKIISCVIKRSDNIRKGLSGGAY